MTLPTVRYDKIVPKGTFLGNYLEYMSNLETPHAYDFWTGCWALSTALGRGIRVNRPGAPVYLNLYCLLVAESGITRKSTAVRMATQLVRPLCIGSPTLVETKITPELLEHKLHEQAAKYGTSYAAISISELVTFMGREKYTEAMPTLLTDLYDSPEIRSGGGSLARGASTLRNVYVSFLSASTPSWLLRAVNPDVIEGGFTSRIMFIVEEQPKQRVPWPEEAHAGLRERLLEQLRGIQFSTSSVPHIEISDGGLNKFKAWYKTRLIHRDPFRASFQSREDSHILRLAGLLCINDGTWIIQHTHIGHAIRIITQVREDGAGIFEGTGTSSKLVVGIDRLRDKLLAGGINGVSQTVLTKAVANYMNAEHMKAALDIMQELGMVQQFAPIQLGRGRPKTIWRGLAPIAQPGAIDKIIEKHTP